MFGEEVRRNLYRSRNSKACIRLEENTKKQPLKMVCKNMKPTPEQTAEYIKALEAVNKQLVYSLKQCLKLLANVPPEVADKEKWKDLLEDFNKILAIGEKVTMDRTLH